MHGALGPSRPGPRLRLTLRVLSQILTTDRPGGRKSRRMGRLGKKSAVLVAIASVAGSAILADHLASRRHLDRLLTDANAALDQRDFPTASARLNEYLESRPDDLPVRLLAAQTARRQGDFDAAHGQLRRYQDAGGPPEARLRELQLLIAQEDGTSDADALMASCLSPAPPPDVDLVLEVAIEQHLKLLDRAYRSGKTLVDGPSGKARAQTERAIAVWLQRRPLQADQIQGLIWRGDLDLLTNRRAAVDDFRQATEIDPTHFNARLDLAIALVEYDMSEAAQHLEFLHTRDPENQQVSLLLAQVRRSLGQPEAAISLIDELLRRNPTHSAAVLERGKAALDLGRPAEAEQSLRLAVGQTPDDPLAHLALSRCLLLLGKEAESKAHEQRYQELELKRLEAEENLAASRRDWQNRTDRGERAPRPGAPMR